MRTLQSPSADGRMEGERKRECKRKGGGRNQLIFCFFHFSRTIKISVLHACLTHTVRRPPPLFPLSASSVEMHLPISISLTSITYPSPSPPLLIRPTHSKLAAAITGNIKHGHRQAPSDRYHTDHRQTPTVTRIIIVGNDHTRERADHESLMCLDPDIFPVLLFVHTDLQKSDF